MVRSLDTQDKDTSNFQGRTFVVGNFPKFIPRLPFETRDPNSLKPAFSYTWILLSFLQTWQTFTKTLRGIPFLNHPHLLWDLPLHSLMLQLLLLYLLATNKAMAQPSHLGKDMPGHPVSLKDSNKLIPRHPVAILQSYRTWGSVWKEPLLRRCAFGGSNTNPQ